MVVSGGVGWAACGRGGRGAPGNGLGLALVQAAASLHGAKIELADNQPGLLVQIRFPMV